MNHDEATQLMITEKYLLNELSPKEREEFEEHFFECVECARDLRAGVTFLEQSKTILASRADSGAGALAPASSPKRGWLAGVFRPAFALPVMALMLATIGYLSLTPRSKPQLLSAAFLNVGSRGGNTPLVKVHGNDSFLVRVSVPPEHDYSSYLVAVSSPSGKPVGPVSIPVSLDDDSYFVGMPAGHHEEGTYTVAVRGITSTGQSDEIGRTKFELRVLP